ncbi:uncharacterized protein LOC108683236 [Hyalella azteca]|uniref:Uncharacterized protein LOC108683236 n=1 Tax=Hyalella azteca TaxID=294128 RepID=A0A8B7PRB6_HYAAZ|nr:uncharacterized protein LOC108683236 [Hyalella azteca]
MCRFMRCTSPIPVTNYEDDDNGPVYIVRDGKRYSARQMARSADFRNLISYERIWQSSSDGSVVIPYKFTAWEGVEPNRPNFTKAMEEYEAGTCIVFREMDEGEKPSSYMELINDKSCSANVGRVTDGPTWVSERDSCGVYNFP